MEDFTSRLFTYNSFHWNCIRSWVSLNQERKKNILLSLPILINRDLQPTPPNKIWRATTDPTECVKQLIYRHIQIVLLSLHSTCSLPQWFQAAFKHLIAIYIFLPKLITTCYYIWYLTHSSSLVINSARFTYNPEVDDGNRNCLTALFSTGDAMSLWSSQSNFLEFYSFISKPGWPAEKSGNSFLWNSEREIQTLTLYFFFPISSIFSLPWVSWVLILLLFLITLAYSEVINVTGCWELHLLEKKCNICRLPVITLTSTITWVGEGSNRTTAICSYC